jgi:outer membrane protein assembly factor BamA
VDQAGSNDSDEDNFLEGSGEDYFFNFRFKYLLPIGNGKDKVINEYVVKNGLLVSGQSGAEEWNPFESGRTSLETEPFYRRQTVETGFTTDTLKTNGVKFSLLYDNTDFRINPSNGSSQSIGISRDWGLFDSTDSWTVIEGEFSKYFPLNAAAGIRQQVLALNFWTAETLSWESQGFDENGKEIFKRPPSYAGATLGGVDRMRGYPFARFNDKAAIYYGLEYRVIPEWNPFRSGFWEKFEIEWIQGVLFFEVGRVSGSWKLSELHSDMKWDVGVGLRTWVKNLVVRMDTAYSEEGMRLHLMVGHPF